jgi:Zn-dependent protease with chaperone function
MSRSEALTRVFSGPIQPVRKSVFYKMAILLVTIVMVLLPGIYFGLMAGVGFGTWRHATGNTFLLSQGRWGILAYVAILLLGAALLILMLKPLLAAPAETPKAVTLSPDEEPELFEHVRRLCGILRAPVPREIRVDCQVNASASFRRGWWSLLGNDLTLTIGLPLVTTLDLRQLTGVIAHELGHFAQGGGMRLTFVVRSINVWFARVVYGRDEVDAGLARAMNSSSNVIYVFLLVGTVRLGVWLTKRILWLLMVTGHAVSSFLMRQMEFDADRYEARVAGSDAFERTALRLAHVNYSFQAAQSDLGRLWREERIVSDLPDLIAEHLDKQTPELRSALDEQILAARTGNFSTPPAARTLPESSRWTHRPPSCSAIFQASPGKPPSISTRARSAPARPKPKWSIRRGSRRKERNCLRSRTPWRAGFRLASSLRMASWSHGTT